MDLEVTAEEIKCGNNSGREDQEKSKEEMEDSSGTLLRNHIQPERSGTDRFFSYYHFSYIYGLFHCIFKIFH